VGLCSGTFKIALLIGAVISLLCANHGTGIKKVSIGTQKCYAKLVVGMSLFHPVSGKALYQVVVGLSGGEA